MRKLKILGEMLIVTVCAYYLARGTYLLFKPVQLKCPEPEAAVAVSSAHQKISKSSFEIINERNLFGAYDPDDALQKVKVKLNSRSDLAKLPISASKYRLIGTVYASEPRLRRAVILVDGKVHVLKKNQTVRDIKINEIKRRAVVLTRGQLKELLVIDKDDKKIASESDSGSILLSKKELKKVLEKPEDLLSSVDFAPAEVGGKKGLLVNSVSDRSVLADLGIKKGDLIVSVNGKRLNSLADIISLAKLGVKNSIEIKIWRNKRFETLKLKFGNA